MCLVRNVIVLFYGYVYEGYYENNVDRCFDYLSGYVDNSTALPSHLVSHPEGEFTPFAWVVNPRQHCWVVEVEDHEEMGKREI